MQRSHEAENLKPMPMGSLNKIQTSGKVKSSPMDDGSFSVTINFVLGSKLIHYTCYGITGYLPSLHGNFVSIFERFFHGL